MENGEWRMEIGSKWPDPCTVDGSEPLHWLSYGNGWELAGSGIVQGMQPSSTHDRFPRRPSLAFLGHGGILSTPRRLSKRKMTTAAPARRGWVQDAETGGDGGGGDDGGGGGSGSGGDDDDDSGPLLF